MNVLIYTGPGAVTPSTTQSLAAFRQLLFPHYAVATIDTEALLHQPWSDSCALLVFPEGYESEYTEALGTQGRAGIVKYVRDGGKFLAVGDGIAPACGGEENLGFYKGGWTREKENTKEKSWATISAEGKLFQLKKAGGFMGAEGGDGNDAKILGTFADQIGLGTSGGGGKAAVLYCTVADGAVILASVELT
jgi:biotin--protein ligase